MVPGLPNLPHLQVQASERWETVLLFLFFIFSGQPGFSSGLHICMCIQAHMCTHISHTMPCIHTHMFTYTYTRVEEERKQAQIPFDIVYDSKLYKIKSISPNFSLETFSLLSYWVSSFIVDKPCLSQELSLLTWFAIRFVLHKPSLACVLYFFG